MVAQSSLAFCLEWLTNEGILAAVVIMNSVTKIVRDLRGLSEQSGTFLNIYLVLCQHD